MIEKLYESLLKLLLARITAVALIVIVQSSHRSELL